MATTDKTPKPAVIKMVAVKRLKPAAWNPRMITDERFRALCASIQADPEFMSRRPVLTQKDGTIYGGNQRYRACVELGWDKVPAIVEDVNDQTARERMLRDNNQWGDWQEDELPVVLDELRSLGVDLSTLGFTDDVLRELTEVSPLGDFGSDGSLLALSEITIDEPRRKVQCGQVWKIGDRHYLVCVDVFTGWPAYVSFLNDGAMLVPYAGPFVAVTLKADQFNLVIVQPDSYIAGHILDRYEDINGVDTVALTTG